MARENKTAQFKIDWKIKQFEDFPFEKGQLLSSPTFVIDTVYKSEWVLHLYPNGDDDGNGEYTALYLVRKPDDEHPRDIVLDCELSFSTPEKKPETTPVSWVFPENEKEIPVSWKTTNHTFKKGGRCGSQELLEKDKISKFLQDGTLHVSCVVLQHDADASKSGGCTAVSLVGTDQITFLWDIEDLEDLQPGDKRVGPVKTASKDTQSMTMSLSITRENDMMVDISPVDRKSIKRTLCILRLRNDTDVGACVFNETEIEENWSFPLWMSKEELLKNRTTDGSLHLKCVLIFYLGIVFEKIENTYYEPLSDLKSDKDACSIM